MRKEGCRKTAARKKGILHRVKKKLRGLAGKKKRKKRKKKKNRR